LSGGAESSPGLIPMRINSTFLWVFLLSNHPLSTICSETRFADVPLLFKETYNVLGVTAKTLSYLQSTVQRIPHVISANIALKMADLEFDFVERAAKVVDKIRGIQYIGMCPGLKTLPALLKDYTEVSIYYYCFQQTCDMTAPSPDQRFTLSGQICYPTDPTVSNLFAQFVFEIHRLSKYFRSASIDSVALALMIQNHYEFVMGMVGTVWWLTARGSRRMGQAAWCFELPIKTFHAAMTSFTFMVRPVLVGSEVDIVETVWPVQSAHTVDRFSLQEIVEMSHDSHNNLFKVTERGNTQMQTSVIKTHHTKNIPSVDYLQREAVLGVNGVLSVALTLLCKHDFLAGYTMTRLYYDISVYYVNMVVSNIFCTHII
jgi:hypothetical protein